MAKKLKMLTKCAAPPSTNTMPDQPLKHSSSPLAHMSMKEVATSNELVRSSPMRCKHILENKSKHMWGDDGWNDEGWESVESNDRWGHNDIKKRNEILSAPEDASPGVGSSASSFAMGFANGGGHRRLNRGVKKKRKIGLGSKSSKTKSLKSKGSKSKGAKSKSSSTSSKKCKKWVCEPTSFP